MNILKDPKVPEADKEKIKKIKAMFKDTQALPTYLLQYRFLFAQYD